MSDVNVSLQNTNLVANLNDVNIVIETTEQNLTVELGQPNEVNIQIQNPNVVLNLGCGCTGGGAGGDNWGTQVVEHDGTLTGDGTTGNPLSVIGGGGGGASIVSKTYAEMQTLIAADGLTPGQNYLITDAAGSDLGVVLMAVTVNELAVAGSGGFLNADFQAVGDYSGVEAQTGIAAGTQYGIWRVSFETDPVITTGDIVIWNLTHYQCTDFGAVDGTDPATNTAAYTVLSRTVAGVGYVTEWDVVEFDFLQNLIVFRSDLRGNVVRGNIGVAGFQWGNGSCLNNNIQFPASFDLINLIASFQSNTVYSGASIFSIITDIQSEISNNIIENGAQLFSITAGDNVSIVNNKIGQGGYIGDQIVFGSGCLVQNNILENGAQLTGITAGSNCSISRNKIGQGATMGGSTVLGDGCAIDDNALGSTAKIESNTLLNTASITSNTLFIAGYIGNNIIGEGSSITNSTLFADGSINNCVLGASALIATNFLESNGSITGIETGTSCSISRNTIGQGATMGGSTVLGDGANINDLDIRANKQLSNKTLDAGVNFSDKILQLTADGTETISENIEGNRAQPGFSDIPKSFDITSLTTLDYLAENNYVGIANLTSSNATESIDTISNFPTLFPFTLRPAAGLTLTVTGTAIAGIGAGQIALTTANVVLNGDNGEWLELEADPNGGGFLREKNRSGTIL